MYAIILTGGKQYTVKPGDVVQVEKLDNKLGSEFNIDEILLVGGEKTHVGQPLVKNAKVTVVVTKQAKSRKVIVFKKKRRHSFRKFKTHRQPFTELFVKAITGPDGQVIKSDDKPNVMDMFEVRAAKIQAKIDAKTERLENKEESSEEKTASPKKVAKKSAAPKKKAAKKASGAKKSTKAKKGGAKKAAKKTSKKA